MSGPTAPVPPLTDATLGAGGAMEPLPQAAPAPPVTLTDTARRDVIELGPAAETVALQRDSRWDRIEGFEDGVDRIDLSDFLLTVESLMLVRIDALTYQVYTRDEGITIRFAAPETPVADDAWLLDADDFVFAEGLATPPVQVQLEQSATEREALTGTTLPDIFTFAPDGTGDTINRFEIGKDRIDLSGFNTAFEDLEIVTRFDGRVSVRITTDPGTDEELYDWFQINDRSDLLTAADFTADAFIF